jgi:hypothetical protein
VSTRSIATAAIALAMTSTVACAEPRIDLSLAGLADNADGRSLDFDTAIAPSAAWEFGAGAGSTTSRTGSGDLTGTSVRAMAEVHSEQLGLRGYYRRWSSDGLDTDATGGRAFFRNGGLTLSVLGETRGVDVDYAIGSASTQRSTARFSGTGWGGGASYSWANWNASAEGTHYHYGSLSRYVQTQAPASTTPPSSTTPLSPTLPTLPGLPPIAAAPGAVQSALPGLTESVLYTVPTLSGSYVTLNQGVFARVLSAALERDFKRSSVRLNWTGANDVVLDTEIDSYSAGYRYSLTDRLSGGVTLGISHSRYGSVNFGGVAFGMSL